MSAQPEVKLSAEPQLGQHIAVPRRADIGRCMSSPGQLDKCFRATANGVVYTIAFRRRGSLGNVVTYLHTEDSNFKSPGGLYVGGVVAVEDVIAAPGFEVYGARSEGWVPVVGFNGNVEVVDDGKPDEKQEVSRLSPAKGNPVRLRIQGFTMRRKPPILQQPQSTTNTMQ